MPSITIELGSEIRFDPAALSEAHFYMLESMYSIPNPEYAMRKRRNLWLGNTPETLCVLGSEGEKTCYLPRGTYRQFKGFLAGKGYGVTTNFLYRDTDPLELELQISLRDYQEEAVDALYSPHSLHECGGIVVSPPGSGKTIMGCGIIHRIQRPALVIVHTKDLLTQWCERIKMALGIEAGTIGGGKKAKLRPVTVAMIQSLVRKDEEAIRELGRMYPVVICDEAHHAPASTYRKVFANMASPCKIGITATPERNDGLTKYLEWFIGPIVHTIHHKELVEQGHLVLPKVIPVETGFDENPDEVTLSCALCRRRWDVERSSIKDHKCLPCPSCVKKFEQQIRFANGTTLMHAISAKQDAMKSAEVMTDFAWYAAESTIDDHRNRIIREICKREIEQGRRVLVLTGRVDHAQWLAFYISLTGISAAEATGETGKLSREESIAGLSTGEVDVLIATQLADEGLDVVKLDTVVLTMPQRAAGRTLQRVGRTMRPSPGKEPRVYDLVDEAGVLKNQWWARKRAYKKLLGIYPTRPIRFER